jgi:hypothetical protein
VEDNMADLNRLWQLFQKGVNPDLTDEDISSQTQLSPEQKGVWENSQLMQLMSQPSEKESVEQVEANPDEPKNPLDLNIQTPHIMPSSFDVSSGMQPSTLKMDGQIGNVTPPEAPKVVNPEIPTLMAQNPDVAPTMPLEPPTKAVEQRKSEKGSTPKGDPLESILDQTNPDWEARQKFNEDESKKHMLGLIPTGLAGVGDAISNAGSAFGAKGTTGGLERTQATLIHGEKLRKAQFDENLLNDPNSDISKHYQNTLAMMMQTKPTDPKIINLSAEQIKQTLPEVEKFITHQLQREATQAGKELGISEKQSQFDSRQWERLESRANNLNAGSRKALGVATINNMRADRLLSTSNMKVITPQVYNALVADLQGIYKGGVPDQVMMKHGDYTSIQRLAAEILQKITGKPQNVNTPEIKQYLLDLTRDIKAIDNKVITDNLGIQAVIFRDLIRKDPERWNDLVAAITRTTEEPATSTGHGTLGASSKAPGEPGSSKSVETPSGKSSLAPNEEVRIAKDGRKIVYDKETKQPIRVYGE